MYKIYPKLKQIKSLFEIATKFVHQRKVPRVLIS